MAIFIGSIVILICIAVIWKSAWLGMNIPITWAERHLRGAGQAGSTTFYRLVALLLIIAAFLYMTGFLQYVIIAIFSQRAGN